MSMRTRKNMYISRKSIIHTKVHIKSRKILRVRTRLAERSRYVHNIVYISTGGKVNLLIIVRGLVSFVEYLLDDESGIVLRPWLENFCSCS